MFCLRCLYSSVRKGKKDDGLIICKSSHTDPQET